VIRPSVFVLRSSYFVLHVDGWSLRQKEDGDWHAKAVRRIPVPGFVVSHDSNGKTASLLDVLADQVQEEGGLARALCTFVFRPSPFVLHTSGSSFSPSTGS
jgi:hypothetical protein